MKFFFVLWLTLADMCTERLSFLVFLFWKAHRKILRGVFVLYGEWKKKREGERDPPVNRTLHGGCRNYNRDVWGISKLEHSSGLPERKSKKFPPPSSFLFFVFYKCVSVVKFYKRIGNTNGLLVTVLLNQWVRIKKKFYYYYVYWSWPYPFFLI